MKILNENKRKKKKKVDAFAMSYHPHADLDTEMNAFNNSVDFSSLAEAYGENWSREQYIAALQEYGLNYRFEKYSDDLLFNIFMKLYHKYGPPKSKPTQKDSEDQLQSLLQLPKKRISYSTIFYDEESDDYCIPEVDIKFPTEKEAIEYIDLLNGKNNAQEGLNYKMKTSKRTANSRSMNLKESSSKLYYATYTPEWGMNNGDWVVRTKSGFTTTTDIKKASVFEGSEEEALEIKTYFSGGKLIRKPYANGEVRFYETSMMMTESLEDWKLVKHKYVTDSDGFLTDYVWYTDGDKHIFMFGDMDYYEPDEDYADYVCDDYNEAEDWFYDYDSEEAEEDDDWRYESLDTKYYAIYKVDEDGSDTLHEALSCKTEDIRPYVSKLNKNSKNSYFYTEIPEDEYESYTCEECKVSDTHSTHPKTDALKKQNIDESLPEQSEDSNKMYTICIADMSDQGDAENGPPTKNNIYTEVVSASNEDNAKEVIASELLDTDVIVDIHESTAKEIEEYNSIMDRLALEQSDYDAMAANGYMDESLKESEEIETMPSETVLYGVNLHSTMTGQDLYILANKKDALDVNTISDMLLYVTGCTGETDDEDTSYEQDMNSRLTKFNTWVDKNNYIYVTDDDWDLKLGDNGNTYYYNDNPIEVIHTIEDRF